MKKVSIANIRVNGGTQSRAEINRETVADYAEAIEGGAEFPPVVVFYDGSTYWLADGFHRYEAHARANVYEVMADVRQGTQRDAILHSVGANAAHGLRRTNDDKRRAVMTLLNDPEWASNSDRWVARTAGVSHTLVQKIRSEHLATLPDKPAARTVERSGTTYQQNTANIGGSKAGQERTAQAPQENMAETAISSDVGTTQSKAGQEMQEPEQKADPDEGLRQEFQSMTADGQEDDWIGLRREVAELRAERAAQKAEIEALKSRIKELSHENQGAVIGKLQKHLGAVKYERDEAKAATKRMEYRLKKAEARASELEGMGIAL
ncbi:ParB N-terminal domain-containing protein [Pseudophaeobacter sp. 1A09344]|uniref:ParB N-terminal domain-containing protein n=1 Tax=Pseudophaeobacter sp. 1A09344 TaxID=3098144 RepID=UPI0034D673CF